VPEYLIIDGYNAINKIKELEDKKDISLECARDCFIKILKDFMARKGRFRKIFLVFDSKKKGERIRRKTYGNVEVSFGTVSKDADRVIVDMLRAASVSDRISVSSDDNFVRNHTKAFGKDVISISELREIIMLKGERSRSKIKEKELRVDRIKDINEELRRHWGLA